MKRRNAYDFMFDQGFILPKLDKDGEIKEDKDGDIIELPNNTPLTYGMFQDLMEQFMENLKTDLIQIAENDTE